MLKARELHVRYPNGAVGIESVSLDIEAGEMVALVGANGAGKSTTVRAISGFLKSEGASVSGSVTFEGVDVTGQEPHRVSRRGIAVVPERRKTFASLTVMENLAAVNTLPPRRLRAEYFDRVFTLFPDLASAKSKAAGRLSGGQRQMLALGRSFILQPKLIVIDEMTLGLHHSLHRQLYEAARQMADEGTSVLLVDESAADTDGLVDRVYQIESGVVAVPVERTT